MQSRFDVVQLFDNSLTWKGRFDRFEDAWLEAQEAADTLNCRCFVVENKTGRRTELRPRQPSAEKVFLAEKSRTQ